MEEKIDENIINKVLIDIACLKDLKCEDLGNFLQSQGYSWSGSLNYCIYGPSRFPLYGNLNFEKPSYDFFTAHNCIFFWTGEPQDKMFQACYSDPHVKFIYFEIDKFEIYSLVQEDIFVKELTKKLEKDLSKEWMQFLAKNKRFYHEGLIKLCTQRKIRALEELESTKQKVKLEKERLDRELEEKTISTNNQIDFLDSVSRCIQELN